MFQDELFTYAQRPRRTILEVLADFKSIMIPVEYVLDVFPIIRPRKFSISNASQASSLHWHSFPAFPLQLIGL